MASEDKLTVLTNAQWAVLEPLRRVGRPAGVDAAAGWGGGGMVFLDGSRIRLSVVEVDGASLTASMCQ